MTMTRNPCDPGSVAPPPAAAATRPAPRLSPLVLLSLGALAWRFGFGVYRAIYNNFLVEVHGIRPDQLGLIESIREVPGLLVVFLVALVAGLAPSLVTGAACLLLA
ncbi:MAG TPA: hypothetical protein DHW14_07765, partial [Clostridiales bacterium]|nr:hypothetical protein [Clostridiales bacterium]